jgi:hypothetical protein
MGLNGIGKMKMFLCAALVNLCDVKYLSQRYYVEVNRTVTMLCKSISGHQHMPDLIPVCKELENSFKAMQVDDAC